MATAESGHARDTIRPTELTWLGHGTWLVRTGGATLIVDPFLDDSPTAPYKAAEVNADYVLVSHGHFDHVADAAAIAARCGATVIANFEICQWLAARGATKTEPMNLGGAIATPFGRVKLTLAHHSSTLPDGASGGNPGGFLLSLADGKVYFAGDTALFADMKLIGDAGIDLAVVPIGDRFTMGPDDSLKAIQLLRPKRVAPAHYNTWPPIAQDAAAWGARVRQETAAVPVVLEPGGTTAL
jgi:L-ascorbate metabolism protein UlaG (beta-lactamase superfamily)